MPLQKKRPPPVVEGEGEEDEGESKPPTPPSKLSKK
jgi:hypothetical protein